MLNDTTSSLWILNAHGRLINSLDKSIGDMNSLNGISPFDSVTGIWTQTWGYSGWMPILVGEREREFEIKIIIQLLLNLWNLITIDYLVSASKNIGILLKFEVLPITQTTSPYSCIILIISHVVFGVQSVNRETSNGTLSTFSRCGLMFSMPKYHQKKRRR